MTKVTTITAPAGTAIGSDVEVNGQVGTIVGIKENGFCLVQMSDTVEVVRIKKTFGHLTYPTKVNREMNKWLFHNQSSIGKEVNTKGPKHIQLVTRIKKGEKVISHYVMGHMDNVHNVVFTLEDGSKFGWAIECVDIERLTNNLEYAVSLVSEKVPMSANQQMIRAVEAVLRGLKNGVDNGCDDNTSWSSHPIIDGSIKVGTLMEIIIDDGTLTD